MSHTKNRRYNPGCTSCTQEQDCGCNSCSNTCGCKVTLTTNCVKHTGADLECLGIVTGDSLETMFSKVNEILCNLEDTDTNNIVYCGDPIACNEENVVTSGMTLTEIIQSLSDRICETNSSNYTGDTVICGEEALATEGESWATILERICSLINSNRTFNIISLRGGDGNNETFTISGNTGTNITGDQVLWIDRVNDTSDVVVTITSADGITFDGAVLFKTIASTYSSIFVEFAHPTGLTAGSYDVVLTWVSDYETRIQNITFTLT